MKLTSSIHNLQICPFLLRNGGSTDASSLGNKKSIDWLSKDASILFLSTISNHEGDSHWWLRPGWGESRPLSAQMWARLRKQVLVGIDSGQVEVKAPPLILSLPGIQWRRTATQARRVEAWTGRTFLITSTQFCVRRSSEDLSYWLTMLVPRG